jgi:hypothetical protein
MTKTLAQKVQEPATMLMPPHGHLERFTVHRHYNSGGPHYGYPTEHAEEAEQVLGVRLPAGTVVRREVIYQIVSIPDGPEPVSHWHTDRPGRVDTNPSCPECVAEHPERYVLLECGHAISVYQYESQQLGQADALRIYDREGEMSTKIVLELGTAICIDGWAPRHDRKPQKVIER